MEEIKERIAICEGVDGVSPAREEMPCVAYLERNNDYLCIR